MVLEGLARRGVAYQASPTAPLMFPRMYISKDIMLCLMVSFYVKGCLYMSKDVRQRGVADGSAFARVGSGRTERGGGFH